MSYLCNLYNCCGGTRLFRLLALLLALAVTTPVLLGEDGNHDRDQGRFVDPIVGSWIVHVTVTAYKPTLPGFIASQVRQSERVFSKWHQHWFRPYRRSRIRCLAKNRREVLHQEYNNRSSEFQWAPGRVNRYGSW